MYLFKYNDDGTLNLDHKDDRTGTEFNLTIGT